MTGRWSRRALLANLGAVAVAGCTSDTDDRDTTDTPTASPTPAPTPTPSPTDGHTGSGNGGSPTATPDPGTESPSATDAKTPEGTPTSPSSVDSDWPVPGADAGRSSYASEAAGPTAAVAELWRVTAPTGLSAPTIVDGTVYVGGNDGNVRAVDAATGERQWRVSVGDAAGTPRVVGSRVFVPADGALVALDPGNGEEVWRVETPTRRGLLVAGHGVYWIDESGPTVAALAHEDGSERWQTDIADPWEARVFASESRVFVPSGTHDNRFWALAADTGDIVRKEPRSGADFPAEQFYRAGTVYAVDAFFGNVRATAVSDDGAGWYVGVPPGGDAGGGLLAGDDERVYYTANVEGEPGLTALSATSGGVEWTAEVPPVITGRPAVAGETVVVPTDDGLRSYDPADGSRQWASGVETGGDLVVADDLVFTTVDRTVMAYRPP